MSEIKPFSARSDVTVFEFLDKFNTYCTGSKKGKAYKLYNNYLSGSIQAQMNLLQQDFDGLVNFLKTNYGRIEVISNGLLSELEKKKKPGDNDFLEKAESLLRCTSMTTSSSRAGSDGNKTSGSPAHWTPTPMNYSSAKPSSPCPRHWLKIF